MKPMERVVFLMPVLLVLLGVGDSSRLSEEPTGEESLCSQVLRSQGAAGMDCTPYADVIHRDMERLYQEGNAYRSVIDKWNADRDHALDPNVTFESLVNSGVCTKMMCYKRGVPAFMKERSFEIPHFCKRKSGRSYARQSGRFSRTEHWTRKQMISAFCAKAHNPRLHYH